jgi:uncharacterized Fe-S center protein
MVIHHDEKENNMTRFVTSLVSGIRGRRALSNFGYTMLLGCDCVCVSDSFVVSMVGIVHWLDTVLILNPAVQAVSYFQSLFNECPCLETLAPNNSHCYDGQIGAVNNTQLCILLEDSTKTTVG